MTTKKVMKGSSKNNTSKIVGAIAGIAAISVATYLLAGPHGKKNRKDLKAWMLKMKADVAEKVENLKEVSATKYHDIVDEVANKYSKLKNIDKNDIMAEAMHLKKEWSKMTKSGKKSVKKLARTVKQGGSTKKVTKKSK